ncbi:hypothetical protein CsSME_00024727 [Camellia sinensis var. sinensis]
MDLSKLQSRVSSSYIPPHRTQLHPRTILYPNPRASSSSSNRDKCLILFASLFVFPFLFYLFYTAIGVHQSSKFGESKTNSSVSSSMPPQPTLEFTSSSSSTLVPPLLR